MIQTLVTKRDNEFKKDVLGCITMMKGYCPNFSRDSLEQFVKDSDVIPNDDYQRSMLEDMINHAVYKMEEGLKVKELAKV